MMKPDGSDRRLVADGFNPTWSPDGKRLAFVAGEGDKSDIWVTGERVTESAKLTETGDWSPGLYWSPDGKYIASFSCDGFCNCIFPKPTCKMHAINIDTGESHNLTDGYPIGWSTDSRSVIYERICCEPDPVESRDLYSVDIESGGTTKLIARDDDVVDAWFSPDGRKIAYIHQCCGGIVYNQELHVMNPDGSDKKSIAPGIEVHGDPLWSPNGERIAFTSGNVIYTVRPDGTGLSVLPATYVAIAGPSSSEEIDDSDKLDNFRLGSLSWSPDSAKLALDYDYDIWLLKVDGTDLINLTQSEERESGISWGR
jgi:Tol biopolymer transport system component